jgi:Protein of unknown function (DUF3375)
VEVDSSALFEQVYVDRTVLASGVRKALQHRSQVSLSEFLRDKPLEQGLAELVGYLSLTDDTFGVVFDDGMHEQVSWHDDGHERIATLPRVTYVRSLGSGEGELP